MLAWQSLLIAQFHALRNGNPNPLGLGVCQSYPVLKVVFFNQSHFLIYTEGSLLF